jgi:hypothetical protein
MTPENAIQSADIYAQVFCKAVAGAIRGLLPKTSRLRFRLQIAVEGRNVQVEPQLRPYREGKDHSG